MLRLEGLTALVTGASAGLGVSFARELARRKVGKLVLVARRKERMEALAGELGLPCEVVACDLGSPTEVDALIARFDAIDVVVNNAGFGENADLAPNDRSLQMVDLNVRALTALSRAWLDHMKAQGRGGILNVGSTAGMVPLPGQAVYAATKAYVNSFSDALRTEVMPFGVHVSCVAPGPVDTEFFGVASPGGKSPPSFIMLGPEECVRKAVDGLVDNTPIVVPELHMRLTMAAAQAAPSWLVRPFTRLYRQALIQLSAGGGKP